MRVDLLSDGRLLELLTEATCTCDPMPEVAILSTALLVEIARRLVRRKEAATIPGPQ